MEPDETLAAILTERIKDLGWVVTMNSISDGHHRAVEARRGDVTRRAEADTLYAAIVQLAEKVGIDLE